MLEQEKREQEKQQQQHQADTTTPSNSLLSDLEFERLREDVLGTNQLNLNGQGNVPQQNPVNQQVRPVAVGRPPTVGLQQCWQQPLAEAGKVAIQKPSANTQAVIERWFYLLIFIFNYSTFSNIWTKTNSLFHLNYGNYLDSDMCIN